MMKNTKPFLPTWLASPPGTNALSRLIGKMADSRLPKPLLQQAIAAYVRINHINMEETELPATDYHTFADFFSRKLKSGMRPIAKSELVSPVDGTVQGFGRIEEEGLSQVKGYSYAVDEFLDSDLTGQDFQSGWYVVIYLSPADYHRIHAPCAGKIKAYTYVPGTLVSVQPFFMNLVSGLLISNERVHTWMETVLGPMVVSKVGASGVGRIRLSYDEVETNVKTCKTYREHVYASRIPVEKGGELGAFVLGSTVVLLISNPSLKPVPELEPGMKIRMGSPLMTL